MEQLPPRVLAILAVAGAIATFATSAGDAFPYWVPRASLIVALAFALFAGAMFLISTYPARVRRWRPRCLTARMTAVPIATHRRQLIREQKVPVIAEDFKVVWQDWCDEVTALLRGEGFPYERPYREGADEEALICTYYKSGLRNRALRHADEASDQGMVDRLYREDFYAPTSAKDIWKLVRDAAERFIEPVSTPRPSERGRPTPLAL
jgi:hypothetical protein